MKTRRSHRHILALCAAAALTGCGGVRPASYAEGVLPQAPSIEIPADRRSWMLPQAKNQSLLYVSDLGANAVDVYPYPSGKLVGSLHGFGSVAGLCVDKAGDVFVVDEAGPVQVFAHGGTSPIRELTTSGAPYGCAVDPAGGNLAVTNLSSVLYGTVAIYTKAKGSAKEYLDDKVDATFFCGYDGSGNLFADGWDRYGNPILLKLPKGSKTFRPFKLNASDTNPGGVQWDGKYVAVGNRGGGVIYRTSATTGKTVQTITLKDGANVEQFWIAGSTVIGPNAQSGGTVNYWHYPAGGSATKTISGFSYPFGATVSPGTKR